MVKAAKFAIAILVFILLGAMLKPGTSFAADSLVSIVSGASTLGNNAFNPSTVEITVGDTITWKNNDSVVHAISNYGLGYLTEYAVIKPDSTFTSRFIHEGNYIITCLLHPQMRGIVNASSPFSDPPPHPNLPPYAEDDAFATPLNTSVTLNVLENDGDPDFNDLAIASVTAPPHGTAVTNGENQLVYTPNTGFIGNDTFDYTISDGRDGSDTATVTVEVGNHIPIAKDDAISAHSLSPQLINPLSNDVDPDGDSLVISKILTYENDAGWNPSNMTIFANGTIAITPNSAVRYVATDGKGGEATAQLLAYSYPTPAPSPGTVEFSAHWHDTPGAGGGTPETEDCITPSCPPVFGTAHKSAEGIVTGSWGEHLPRGALCSVSGPIQELTTNGTTFELKGVYAGSCSEIENGTPVIVTGECGPDSEISFKLGSSESKFIGESACGPAESPVPLHPPVLMINSTDTLGKPISGLKVTVRSSEGVLLESGFTPMTFIAGNNVTTTAAYKVTIANYDGRLFQHWEDGSISKTRMISNLIDENKTLIATFDQGDSIRGFTSLTYSGTAEQPDLTVNAKSLDGNQTLHMWAIIDPQFTNSSGTTYKIYATNGYQNLTFDHWSDNGSTDRVRTLTIDRATTITAYYRAGL